MVLFNHRSRKNNGERSRIEPQCNYYTMNRTRVDSLLNEARRAITQLPGVGWSGHWWQAPQMSCAFCDWRGNSEPCEASRRIKTKTAYGYHAEGFRRSEWLGFPGCSRTLHGTGYRLTKAASTYKLGLGYEWTKIQRRTIFSFLNVWRVQLYQNVPWRINMLL